MLLKLLSANPMWGRITECGYENSGKNERFPKYKAQKLIQNQTSGGVLAVLIHVLYDFITALALNMVCWALI